MTRRIMLSAAGLAALLGCSDPVNTNTSPGDAGVPDAPGVTDAPTSGDAPAAGLSIDQFAATAQRAFCDLFVSCPQRGDGAGIAALFGDGATCARFIGRISGPSFDDLVAGVRAGRIRYDGVAAQRCLTALSSACSTSDEPDAVCREAFTGALAAGAGCWRSEECAAGLYCDHGPLDAQRCPGVCAARRDPGAACDSSEQCRGTDALVGLCDDTQHCAQARREVAAVGGACGRIADGDRRYRQVVCGAGLYCSPRGADAPGVCEAPVARDAPCTTSQACAPGLLCQMSAGTTTTTCRPIDLARNVGDACARSGLPACSPLLGLQCNASNRCERLGDGTAGAACVPGDLSWAYCNDGLFCDSATRVCTARRAVGAACTSDTQCASQSCGDGRCLERICN